MYTWSRIIKNKIKFKDDPPMKAAYQLFLFKKPHIVWNVILVSLLSELLYFLTSYKMSIVIPAYINGDIKYCSN